MVKPALIQIHPTLDASVVCPKCRSNRATRHGLLFQGIHVLQTCTCEDCDIDFFHTLPLAHDALWPIAFSDDGLHTCYDAIADLWLAAPLIKGITGNFEIDSVIEKKVLKQSTANGVLLNCLDYCFGHAFAKLWNAQSLLESFPDFSIIVLIPENFEWLVPENVSEVWIVRGKMRDMSRFMINLDAQIKAEIPRFSKFFISAAKVFHDTAKINFELFLRTKKFDHSRFGETTPCVTFILREDRYWHASRIDEFFDRVAIKFKLKKYLAGYFIRKQDALVRATIRIVKKKNKKVKFFIAGFGKKSFFDGVAEDRREEKINTVIELEWCELYSKSHISVGVHGSNMIIPTALSAGFIEILPDHKIQHMGEDTIGNYSGRNSVLLNRHLDEFVTPGKLARHVLHMLSYGKIYERVEG